MTETILLYGDTETGSERDLKACGTYRYAEDPTTFLQLFSYAVGDGPVSLWDAYSGEPMPADLDEYIANPKYIWTFHNAQFDRLIIRHCLKREIPIRRFRCSMAQALSHALPGSLDKLGEVLNIQEDARKIKDGKRLVQLFCKPKKQKDGTLKWATPLTHPEEWARYREYAKTDTAAMRAMIKKLPKWNYPNPTELELWFLDQEMNDRGMQIDLDLAETAVEAITTEQKRLAAKTKEMTDGEVQAASQRDAMLKHIAETYGVTLPNMQKATLETLVADEALPEALKELLQVRLSTCTSSTAKYKKLLQACCKDGRLKGTILYAGASRTLRDAGRIYNPLNQPRPTLKHDYIVAGIDAIKNKTTDILEMEIMELASSSLRYAIIAGKDKKIVAGDLSAIEARVAPYIANEDWKVQFFRDFDAGKVKFDNYEFAYAKSFGVDPSKVNKEQRQIGKIQELALSFGGGAGSLVSFCVVYHIDVAELADKIRSTLPQKALEEAEGFYDWMQRQEIKAAKERAKEEGREEDFEEFRNSRTYGLPKNAYVVLDTLKRLWRNEHSRIAATWKEADTAMRNAIEVANTRFDFGKMYAIRKGKWVLVVLPSKHVLCYPGAAINKHGDITFKGVNQYTRRWEEIRTTGAKIFQNCVQAFARDIFKYGQTQAAARGYQPILVVYDELVTEVPDTPEYSVHELSAIMSMNPPWAPDIPLAAEGFEDYRYHK